MSFLVNPRACAGGIIIGLDVCQCVCVCVRVYVSVPDFSRTANAFATKHAMKDKTHGPDAMSSCFMNFFSVVLALTVSVRTCLSKRTSYIYGYT